MSIFGPSPWPVWNITFLMVSFVMPSSAINCRRPRRLMMDSLPVNTTKQRSGRMQEHVQSRRAAHRLSTHYWTVCRAWSRVWSLNLPILGDPSLDILLEQTQNANIKNSYAVSVNEWLTSPLLGTGRPTNIRPGHLHRKWAARRRRQYYTAHI